MTAGEGGSACSLRGFSGVGAAEGCKLSKKSPSSAEAKQSSSAACHVICTVGTALKPILEVHILDLSLPHWTRQNCKAAS